MKRGGSLSFLVGTISNILVMEIGWTDVGSGEYILVSCAYSNTCYFPRNEVVGVFWFHYTPRNKVIGGILVSPCPSVRL